MKGRYNKKILALGCLLVLILPISVVSAGQYQQGPARVEKLPISIPMPLVRITDLGVSCVSDDIYEIDWELTNFGNTMVVIRVEHVTIYPNGTNSTSSYNCTIPAHAFVPGLIRSYYPNQYGTYTFVLTIKNIHGKVLDAESISWERSFPPDEE